jgi:hypothetical protein
MLGTVPLCRKLVVLELIVFLCSRDNLRMVSFYTAPTAVTLFCATWCCEFYMLLLYSSLQHHRMQRGLPFARLPKSLLCMVLVCSIRNCNDAVSFSTNIILL